jgi:hypothetical protein
MLVLPFHLSIWFSIDREKGLVRKAVAQAQFPVSDVKEIAVLLEFLSFAIFFKEPTKAVASNNKFSRADSANGPVPIVCGTDLRS